MLDCIHRLLPGEQPIPYAQIDGLYRVPVGSWSAWKASTTNQVCTLADGSVLAVSATMAELMEASRSSSFPFARPAIGVYCQHGRSAS